MNSQLSLTPLGAGDLIDRAVRFYRKNFWTFVWIAAPPIIVGTIISVLWTIAGRSLFHVDMANNPLETMFYYWFIYLGSVVIWTVETVATLTVMGGASRNFVRHLLFDEPITFRETYRNLKARFFGLTAASFLITLLLGFAGYTVLSIGLIVGLIAVAVAVAAFEFWPFFAFIVSLLLGLAVTFGTVWLFFLIASRFAYVPQVMLVEGQGVFSAIGRSVSLASGNVRRLAALFIFTLLATFSALALLYIPLGWYAWISGVQIMSFDPDAAPAWYEIASQFVWQASLILLMPIWMIGLCLLYVDERVRHEGYDIELLAAQRLGAIPAVPREFVNPLQPALAQEFAANNMPEQLPAQKSPFTTLGLK